MDGDGNHSITGGWTPARIPRLSREEIEHLLASVASLQSDRRLLLDSIRLSLGEMRLLRASLEQRRAKYPDAWNGTLRLTVQLQQDYKLTPRESEVALLLAQGASNVTIASTLGISPHTARHHTQAVLGKIGARSRAEAGAKVRG